MGARRQYTYFYLYYYGVRNLAKFIWLRTRTIAGLGGHRNKCLVIVYMKNWPFINKTSSTGHQFVTLLAWQRSRYSDSLRAGRSGNRNLVGTRVSAPVQTSLRLTQPPIRWVSGLSRG